MKLGQFSVSLTVQDLKVSHAFYEKLGFEVIGGGEDQNYLILRSDEAVIGLFQGMFDKNIMTFNPSEVDVRVIQQNLKEAGIELTTEVETDSGIGHFTLLDPDGNPILFDQHVEETKPKSQAGKAAWIDLTVDDAETVRDFYQAVIGWQPQAVSQGDYDDYNMMQGDTPATGICHKRGSNQDIPSQWMVYFTVSDYDASLEQVTANGGKVLVPTRGEAGQRFAVIEDPAGAVFAMYEVSN
ncbi:MAG: VOC family protein [Chloroflexota bacterium]